ncbi:MAG: EAL domain-containing protein, partial [Pseudomonadota bacterium]
MRAEAFQLTNADIDYAFENNHFEIVFQPIFNLRTGRPARAEAFVRWMHPGLGVLPPGVFIPFLESQGRIGELTRYVLRSALRARRTLRLGDDAPSISVNLSPPLDLAEPAFAPQIEILLREANCPPAALTLECEAPDSLDEVDKYLRRLAPLTQIDVRLALEARGRSGDMLGALSPFPFAEVKTGGPAILRFAKTVRGPGLSAVSALLDFAEKSRVDTVAVGVEDEESLRALSSLGFTMAQGNLLARPAAALGLDADAIAAAGERLGGPAEDDPTEATLAEDPGFPLTNQPSPEQ